MITIVGASGHIGSKLSTILLERGKKLRLIARHAERLLPLQDMGADVYPGSISNYDFLIEAFKDSELVISMIPTDMNVHDVVQQQDVQSITQCSAIKDLGIDSVINISSLGAHTEENNGIVAGLARHEKRLNEIEGLNVLHLRPTYFMENLFTYIPQIKSMNIAISSLEADVEFPLIATKDIAEVLADEIINFDITGTAITPMAGPKDYSMNDIVRILGEAIGKPDVSYLHVSYEDAIKGMEEAGLSHSLAKAYTGLTKGINEGIMKEDNLPLTRTRTSLEQFAKEFAEVYYQEEKKIRQREGKF